MTHHFRDLSTYQASDFTMFSDDAVFMAEKDAVKCFALPSQIGIICLLMQADNNGYRKTKFIIKTKRDPQWPLIQNYLKVSPVQCIKGKLRLDKEIKS